MPLLDLALGIDDHPHALGTLGGIHVRAVGGADGAVGVADQGEIELELLREVLVLRRSVEGHSHDGGVLPVVVGLEVAEPATFGGSARRVRLGEEPQHERLALEVGELHGAAEMVVASEIGSGVSRLEHVISSRGGSEIRLLGRSGGVATRLHALAVRSAVDLEGHEDARLVVHSHRAAQALALVLLLIGRARPRLGKDHLPGIGGGAAGHQGEGDEQAAHAPCGVERTSRHVIEPPWLVMCAAGADSIRKRAGAREPAPRGPSPRLVSFPGDMSTFDLHAVAFPTLDESQLSRIALCTGAVCRPYRKGERLFEAGDLDFKLYLIKTGEVEILEETGETPRTITVHHAGEFTGDIAHLTGRVSVVSAVARTDCELYEVATGDLRLIGSRYSHDTFRIRDFLAKNRLFFTWLDLESDPQVSQLLSQFGFSPADTPVVTFTHKILLRNPSNRELAEVIGLRQPLEHTVYDLVVVGAGPAGLAAAVYGASEGLHTVAIDRVAPGGQAGRRLTIYHYLAFFTPTRR